MPPAVLAEQAEWTEDYAQKMIEFGASLMRSSSALPGDMD